MKIDIYTHITPIKYQVAFEKRVDPEICRLLSRRALPTLTDLNARLALVEKYEGMRQVLTLSNPPVELVTEPAVSLELSRIANDEMAELVVKHPDHFVGAAACLPLNDMDTTLKEVDRAITELKMKGVQIYTNVLGKELDSDWLMPLYERMAQHDLPIWIHPFFQGTGAAVKDGSQFAQFRIGSEEGGPAASLDRAVFRITTGTNTAMTRLVFSHVFDKYPNIKFITHHCGASVPYLAGRIDMHYVPKPADGLQKPILDYYRMFYADSALHGNVPSMMCGYHFFGADHILFGTDMPYGPEMGAWSIRKIAESIEKMSITTDEKEKIFEGNARKLLHLA